MAFRLTAEAVNIASVVLPFVVIFLRPLIRNIFGLAAWGRSAVRYDFIAGVALPSYFAMLYSIIQPDIIPDLDHHVLALAGGIAMVTFFVELFSDAKHEKQMQAGQ